jgi:hypothetical protein
MTVRAAKFTPEVLLGAPRRSSGTPNWSGTLALYSVSTYSFEKQEKTVEIRVLDVAKNESTVITDSKSASNPTWISEDTIALLVSENGATNIVVGSVHDFTNT